MKAKKAILIILAVVVLLAVGVFSVSIATGNFFFTTKYYPTALQAYNAEPPSVAGHRDVEAASEVGLVSLDAETALFIGALDENRFSVSEMEVKNGQYAAKGTVFFYDLRQDADGAERNQTHAADGDVEWAVQYSREEADRMADGATIHSFTYLNGEEILVVVYTN